MADDEQRKVSRICAGCSRVLDTSGAWQSLANREHLNRTEFSHGLCPACVERLYPGLFGEGKSP